jgi:kynurenine formamidase
MSDFSWEPPQYRVDADGRVIGAVCGSTPSNWGRWGALDQRGTANFISPAMVADAARLVERGATFSLAIPIDRGGPFHPLRIPPVHHYAYTGADFVVNGKLARELPGYQGTDDYIFMPLQGSTQWDALAHHAFADTFYNGFWIGTADASGGAQRCGIAHLKEGLIGRGVLLDVARHHGVARLEPGHAIRPDELDACAAAQGVEVRTGDLLLVRTGHLAWFYELEEKAAFWAAGAPGIGQAAVPWIHEREIAALAVDTIAVEVEPFEDPHGAVYPLHARLIRDLGLSLGELWWLEALAEDCAADGRWEFFLSAPPLNLTNASGSPLNPIALK